jgi:hypothetical protein
MEAEHEQSDVSKERKMRTMPGFAVVVVLTVCLAFLNTGSTTAQEKKAESVNKKTAVTSLTLFPVSLAGQAHQRVAEVLGVILDQGGFKKIELAGTVFQPEQASEWNSVASAFGAYLKEHPIKTNHALYCEILASKKEGFMGLRSIIADRKGKVVWVDAQDFDDADFKDEKPDCPMSCCVYLGERILPHLVLAEPGEREKPGPLARRLMEQSGLPDQKERDAMEERLTHLKKIEGKANIMVFPLRIGKKVDPKGAEELVNFLNGQGLCSAKVAEKKPWFDIKRNSNEQRTLWDMAQSFKDYVRKNKPSVDYCLYADYLMNPESGKVGAVHLAVCDRKGEWVIVDFQNSHHEDFQMISPKSLKDCNRLAAIRLKGYLK